MGAGYHGGFGYTREVMRPEYLIHELRVGGVKFNEANVLAVFRQKNGRLVWLESGNDMSGLQHIVRAHGEDFARKGIVNDEILYVIVEVLQHGKEIGVQGKHHKTPRIIYEGIYKEKTIRLSVTIGQNGYIVGANPR